MRRRACATESAAIRVSAVFKIRGKGFSYYVSFRFCLSCSPPHFATDAAAEPGRTELGPVVKVSGFLWGTSPLFKNSRLLYMENVLGLKKNRLFVFLSFSRVSSAPTEKHTDCEIFRYLETMRPLQAAAKRWAGLRTRVVGPGITDADVRLSAVAVTAGPVLLVWAGVVRWLQQLYQQARAAGATSLPAFPLTADAEVSDLDLGDMRFSSHSSSHTPILSSYCRLSTPRRWCRPGGQHNCSTCCR